MICETPQMLGDFPFNWHLNTVFGRTDTGCVSFARLQPVSLPQMQSFLCTFVTKVVTRTFPWACDIGTDRCCRNFWVSVHRRGRNCQSL